MINYINVVIKGTKSRFENARAPAGSKNPPTRADYDAWPAKNYKAKGKAA